MVPFWAKSSAVYEVLQRLICTWQLEVWSMSLSCVSTAVTSYRFDLLLFGSYFCVLNEKRGMVGSLDRPFCWYLSIFGTDSRTFFFWEKNGLLQRAVAPSTCCSTQHGVDGRLVWFLIFEWLATTVALVLTCIDVWSVSYTWIHGCLGRSAV